MRALLLPALLLALVPPAFAQGVVVDRILVEPAPPRPPAQYPMRLKEQRISIEVRDRVEQVSVEQVFSNDNPWPVEGTYLFPLPRDASVSGFSMTMGGKKVAGEILDAKQARDVYRSIVHRRKDPGLLEYVGRRCIRASLFPVPARGTTRVTLRYESVLDKEAGLVEITYPLRTTTFWPGPVDTAVTLSIEDSAGVENLYSPTHALEVARKSGTLTHASFEAGRCRGDRDLRVLYGLGTDDFGLTLAAHRMPGGDGTFLLLLTPPKTGDARRLSEDVVFVLDTSGSMGDRGGKKIQQAKAALSYSLGRLSPGDRFNVVAFSTDVRPFQDGLVEANKDNVAAAIAFVEKQTATGGTAISAALEAALAMKRDPGRVPLVLFLTDGRPTVGPQDRRTIVQTAIQKNTAKARLFVFGVGDDVNAPLLTSLSDESRGAETFVSESEDIERKVSGLFDKITSPVLTDVTLSVDGADAFDVYPRHPGDLFKGQQLIVAGRYRKAGPASVTLSGRVGKQAFARTYRTSFAARADRPYLERIWAVRKVGFLLKEIQRNGEQAELVAAVKRLGVRYGIVTPYTSFLAAQEREIQIAGGAAFNGPSVGGSAASGPVDTGYISGLDRMEDSMKKARAALEKAQESGAGAFAGAKEAVTFATARNTQSAGRGVRFLAGKTFRREKGMWVDLDLESPAAKDAPEKVVEYLSEDYDALLDDAGLARLLSVGPQVKVLYKGTCYVVLMKR